MLSERNRPCAWNHGSIILRGASSLLSEADAAADVRAGERAGVTANSRQGRLRLLPSSAPPYRLLFVISKSRFNS